MSSPRYRFTRLNVASLIAALAVAGWNGVGQSRAADDTSPQQNPPAKLAVKANASDLEHVTAKQDLQPRGLAGVGLTPDQVHAAIDKGSQALWQLIRDKDLKTDGYKFGYLPEHTLAALALVHAGTHKKIPEFDAELRSYLAEVKPRSIGTYRAGIVAMLVEAYGDTQYVPKLEEAARYLLESHGPKGTWGYSENLPDAVFDARLEAQKTALGVVGGIPVDQRIEPWVRTTKLKDSDGDNSVTQYAILGLNAASRAGVKVSPELWRTTLKTTLDRQEKNGGWSYHDRGSSAYGSMTAAGICAVALCRHELGEKEPWKHDAIETGLGWLSTHFSVTKHPENNDWLFYYLYSIERVGRILDTEFIGPHEWYPLGAAYLVKEQKADGLWSTTGSEQDPRRATSFALLFLTRATPSLDLKPKRGGNGTLRTGALAPFNNFYIILDASGSMLAEMDGKVKFDIARDSVRSLVSELPPSSNVALRVYGHRKRAIEEHADEDTELKIPMSPLDQKKFVAALDSLRPRGKTPLALSLEEAIKDLGRVDPEKPVTLLLLTDGGEDTAQPRRDPVKAAEELAEIKGIRFHVVGFDINQPEWTEQLIAMAERGGGHYWPTVRAADLERGVKVAVMGMPEEYAVLDGTGREVIRTAFGKPVTLPEGKYRFKTTYGGNPFEQEFWINTDSTTSITFDASKAPVTARGGSTAEPTRPTERHPEPVTEVVKRFCTNCGAQLKPGAKFCEKCGTKVGL